MTLKEYNSRTLQTSQLTLEMNPEKTQGEIRDYRDDVIINIEFENSPNKLYKLTTPTDNDLLIVMDDWHFEDILKADISSPSNIIFFQKWN